MAQIFTREWNTQFRDADPDGLVGLRGYLAYFQEMVSRYLGSQGKGLDAIRAQYGVIWIYSKFKGEILGKAGFDSPLVLSVWAEAQRSPVRLPLAMEIRCEGALLFAGRLECCLLAPESGRICRLSDIELPQELFGGPPAAVGSFSHLPKSLPDAPEVYRHTVRYTDLDMSRHMNNQNYVPLFLNAFDRAFWQAHTIKEFELHFYRQSYEGQLLRILCEPQGYGAQLLALQPDGAAAAMRLVFGQAG